MLSLALNARVGRARFWRAIATSRLSRRRELLLFLEFLNDAFALQPGQMVDEQDAVQMIHLMLDAHGEQAFRLLYFLIAVVIKILNATGERALYFLKKLRDRQSLRPDPESPDSRNIAAPALRLRQPDP